MGAKSQPGHARQSVTVMNLVRRSINELAGVRWRPANAGPERCLRNVGLRSQSLHFTTLVLRPAAGSSPVQHLP